MGRAARSRVCAGQGLGGELRRANECTDSVCANVAQQLARADALRRLRQASGAPASRGAARSSACARCRQKLRSRRAMVGETFARRLRASGEGGRACTRRVDQIAARSSRRSSGAISACRPTPEQTGREMASGRIQGQSADQSRMRALLGGRERSRRLDKEPGPRSSRGPSGATGMRMQGERGLSTAYRPLAGRGERERPGGVLRRPGSGLGPRQIGSICAVAQGDVMFQG